jgi:hypothetical protein
MAAANAAPEEIEGNHNNKSMVKIMAPSGRIRKQRTILQP